MRVREQVPEQVPERVQLREPEQAQLQQVPERERERERVPMRRHNLWRQWPGSKKHFSSIRPRCFSKPRHSNCASC